MHLLYNEHMMDMLSSKWMRSLKNLNCLFFAPAWTPRPVQKHSVQVFVLEVEVPDDKGMF